MCFCRDPTADSVLLVHVVSVSGELAPSATDLPASARIHEQVQRAIQRQGHGHDQLFHDLRYAQGAANTRRSVEELVFELNNF